MLSPAAVAEIVGPENVLTGDAAAEYSVSGVFPPVVAVPSTREEVAALVSRAAGAGAALVSYGGGTAIDTGRPPTKLDLVLSTARLDRVVDYQPDDMTVTAEPGVTLATLEATLAGRGQFLPLDPPLPERATVGGVVASAASGPWRAGYGTPRDWVIGLRVVGADGREVRGGGQVVKNVAGYDLPKLYTGSYGTLGVITEVTFKVMPKPPVAGYCRVSGLTPETAEALLARVLDSDLLPAVVELAHSHAAAEAGAEAGDGWWLLFQFIHVEEAVEWQLAQLASLADGSAQTKRLSAAEGEQALRGLRDAPAHAPLSARVGTVSSRVADVAARAAELCRVRDIPSWVTAHAATGQVLVHADDSADASFARDLRALAGSVDAPCVFERLPRPLVGEVEPWGEPGTEHRLMRGIKQALDPGGMFSPGRFVGGI